MVYNQKTGSNSWKFKAMSITNLIKLIKKYIKVFISG